MNHFYGVFFEVFYLIWGRMTFINRVYLYAVSEKQFYDQRILMVVF